MPLRRMLALCCLLGCAAPDDLRSTPGASSPVPTSSTPGLTSTPTTGPSQTVPDDPCAGVVEVADDAALQAISGCTAIQGTLVIGPDVTDLSPLDGLQSITGTLDMDDATLHDLAGLEGLTHLNKLKIGIRSEVQVVSGLNQVVEIDEVSLTDSLTELTGLRGVEELQTLVFIGNDQLHTLTGLSSLHSVHGDLYLSGLHALTDGTGLNGLGLVAGDATVSSFNAATVQALAALSEVGGNLDLEWGFADDLQGMTVEQVGGDLTIHNSATLQTLDGLEGLAIVGGTLDVFDNALLFDVSALQNLTSVGGSILFTDNPSLCGSEVTALEQATGLSMLDINNDDCF